MRLKFFLIFLSFVFLAKAQNSAIDSLHVDSLDLQGLMNLKQASDGSDLEKEMDQKINSSSARSLSLRNSPNVISVITAEEIKNSGAKDVLEILYLFNCVDLNVDVQGIVGFNYRGIPANEGKVQILLDGFEINEMSYNTFFLGGEFDLSLIQKIEFVKGSGSSIYGGNASYCVLNIITKLKDKKNDFSIHSLGSINSRSKINYGLSANFTRQVNKNLFVGIQGAHSLANRTDRSYTDVYGSSRDLSDSAFQKSYFLNANIGYKKIDFSSLFHVYNTYQIDNYVTLVDQYYINNFFNISNRLSYHWDINKHHQFQFSATQRHNAPYFGPYLDSSSAENYSIKIDRFSAKVQYHFNYGQWFDFISLNDFFYEIGHSISPGFNDGSSKKYYANVSSYEEVSIKTKFINIIGGIRFNRHSVVGNVVVPRISLLKRINQFNYKLIYSKGYRLPSVENFNTAINKIEAENTDSYDFELGYQIHPQLYISANYYNLLTTNPIVYEGDGLTSIERTANTDAAGTQGAEAELKFKAKKKYFILKYQYITNQGQPINYRYTDAALPNINLGSSAHKWTCYGDIEFGKNLHISPSVSYIGDRFAYFKIDSVPNALQKIPAQFLCHLYLHANQFLNSRFNISIGIQNILNEKVVFPQSYRADHSPLPGMGREFRLKLSYSWN